MEYIKSYLEQTQKAIGGGVNPKVYYACSLMDNFEWAYGFSQRFGIIRVDYETQKRTIKKSGKWYSKVIEENGFSLDG